MIQSEDTFDRVFCRLCSRTIDIEIDRLLRGNTDADNETKV